MTKRAAIYVRVSTDKQTVENQLRELRQIAERRGWQVVEEYHDAGISGAKGRKDRTTAMTEGTHQDRGGMTALSSLRWISDTIEKRCSASSLLMSHVIRAA